MQGFGITPHPSAPLRHVLFVTTRFAHDNSEEFVAAKPTRALFGRSSDDALVALAPPYATLVPLPSMGEARALPLGVVVVGLGDNTADALASLAQLTYACPWAIPCLAHPLAHDRLDALLQLVRELKDRLAVLTSVEDLNSQGGVAALTRAVRTRPRPTATAMAAWICHRIEQPPLQDPLRSQFEMAWHRSPQTRYPSVATYSRLFRRRGAYTARDWRAIARLCWYADSLGREGSAADHCRLRMRTLMRHAPHYLHASHHTIARRLGWEWLLEAALRAGGYVGSPT
jgi:hypothetical protein